MKLKTLRWFSPAAGSLMLCATLSLAQSKETPPTPQAADRIGPSPGERVIQTGFESEEERATLALPAFASWVDEEGRGTVLRVESAEIVPGEENMVRMPIDMSRYAGCRLFFRCKAKAEGVSQPKMSYLGVKYMFHAVSPATGPLWVNENNVYGTFDWKELSFMATVPSDVKGAFLMLGLQGCTGTVFFDDIEITVARRLPVRPAPDPNAPPAFRGHSLPRLRGCMSPHRFLDEDMRVLGRDWNANVIRWQMTTRGGALYRYETDYDLDKYNAWLAEKLDD
ncbi:MAG: hypothetical protein U1E27_13135, partial [Kiritimatiellia bacterium]|nr:hypothetical protein [Kiritimatiellia bacterium]